MNRSRPLQTFTYITLHLNPWHQDSRIRIRTTTRLTFVREDDCETQRKWYGIVNFAFVLKIRAALKTLFSLSLTVDPPCCINERTHSDITNEGATWIKVWSAVRVDTQTEIRSQRSRRSSRGAGSISGKRTRQFSTLSLQPLARIAGLTYILCSEHIGWHLCRDRVERKTRRRLWRSFPPNETSTSTSWIPSWPETPTFTPARNTRPENAAVLWAKSRSAKTRNFFWNVTSADIMWLTE